MNRVYGNKVNTVILNTWTLLLYYEFRKEYYIHEKRELNNSTIIKVQL